MRAVGAHALAGEGGTVRRARCVPSRTTSALEFMADELDEVIGFLYLGTREGPSKLLPEEPLESFVRYF